MATNGNGARGIAAQGLRINLGTLREALRPLRRGALTDGTWFKEITIDHVKKHHAAISAATWEAAYPGLDAEARAERHIKHVAWKASAAGVLASTFASSVEVIAVETGGLAAPVGVPAAMLSMAIEATYTALLQIDLVCDLGSIHHVPFDPEDAGEIATLFAVALGLDHKKSEKPGDKTEAEGMTERLIALQEGEVATRIGRKLLEESVMRNVVPFAGIPISARWNYVGTRLLGRKANRYVRYRRAIRRAFARLDCKAVADPMLLVEGAWLLSTADGDATHEEVMAIALLAESLGALEGRAPLDTRAARVDDEDEWLSRVARAPAESHGAILDTLYLIAATDRELQTPERRILQRVGKALGRAVDFERVERICQHFAHGDDLPAPA
jgi:uncharacterized protein (DUF697 family)